MVISSHTWSATLGNRRAHFVTKEYATRNLAAAVIAFEGTVYDLACTVENDPAAKPDKLCGDLLWTFRVRE